MREKNVSLLEEGVSLLRQRWGTRSLLSDTDDGLIRNPPFLHVIELPISAALFKDSQYGDEIMKELASRYKVQTVSFLWCESLWCRLSAQVYNRIQDFERLAESVLDIKSRLEKHTIPA